MRLRRLYPLLVALLLSCSRPSPTRVIVLGLDGCDPQILRRLIAQNRLPNFARLQSLGGL